MQSQKIRHAPLEKHCEFCATCNSNPFDAQNTQDYIIIKRPKGKKNLVLLSQEAFNTIEETMYLLSTPNNKKRLLESIKELNDGKGINFKLEDLWK